MKRKIIIGAAAAVIASAITAFIALDPVEPPDVRPLHVWVCCSVLGCTEVDGPSDCRASDDLIYCCAPSTNPDGTVSCGC